MNTQAELDKAIADLAAQHPTWDPRLRNERSLGQPELLPVFEAIEALHAQGWQPMAIDAAALKVAG